LQAERIQPWHFRMWQQVHDPDFLPRAREILSLYEQATRLLAEDIWVICVDAKPRSRPGKALTHRVHPFPTRPCRLPCAISAAECEAHALPFRVQVVWLPTYAS
jgi:hypothetical protein